MASLRFQIVSHLMLTAIYGLPAIAVAAPLPWFSGWGRWVMILLSPWLYSVLFVLSAALLSRPFHKGIIEGRVKRDLSDATYRRRRYYGLCWTTLFYCKPIYHFCLTIPWLKRLTFRLFGYRGQMEFTVYPDTWIRDLPLLEIGKGAYLSNRATIGTNMPLRDGTILVEGIRIGERALIGHLVMLAAGVEIGSDSEIEAGCAIGVRAKIGTRCTLNGVAILNHASRVGDEVRIGCGSYIGLGARVRDGARVPAFSSVPDRSTYPHERVKASPDTDLAGTTASMR